MKIIQNITEYTYASGTANPDALQSTTTTIWNGNLNTAPDVETYTLDNLGEMTSKKMKNGLIHSYQYDAAGRQIADIVTDFGQSSIDKSVLGLQYQYDALNHPILFQSMGPSDVNNVNLDPKTWVLKNSVQRIYNGFGQVTEEDQSSSGIISVVKYGYDYSNNHSRLISMTYPDTSVLYYNYSDIPGDVAGLDNSISRVSFLSDSQGNHLEEYQYLGLSTVVTRGHTSNGSTLVLTYIKAPGDPIGDAGDNYTGLDRFGRVINQQWTLATAATQTAPATTTDLEHDQYGYDANSNVLYRDNLVYVDANGKNSLSELYSNSNNGVSYDLLNHLAGFRIGELYAQPGTTTFNSISNGTEDTSQRKNYYWDSQGNLQAIGSFDASNSLITPVNAVSQTAPSGNIYDAWNRFIYATSSITTGVSNTPNDTATSSYQYDALGRKISTVDKLPQLFNLSFTETQNFIYDVNGNVISDSVEQYFESIGGETLLNTTTDRYVWSQAAAQTRLYCATRHPRQAVRRSQSVILP